MLQSADHQERRVSMILENVSQDRDNNLDQIKASKQDLRDVGIKLTAAQDKRQALQCTFQELEMSYNEMTSEIGAMRRKLIKKKSTEQKCTRKALRRKAVTCADEKENCQHPEKNHLKQVAVMQIFKRAHRAPGSDRSCKQDEICVD